MNRSLPILGLAAALLLSGCASNPARNRPLKEPTLEASKAARLLVISATYGSGTEFSDVSYRVNDLLRQPDVRFWATPKWLGSDPTPGWNKALVIIYEVDGRRRTFAAGEGAPVSVDLLLKNKK